MNQSTTARTKRRPSKLTAESSLIVPTNFIQGVRELGYLGLSSALSELIDNSLQADAETIKIEISREIDRQSPVITVVDDGNGMTREELKACLQFGGSGRFNDRNSFGRFGIGLPAASLSQTSRVEVISWGREEPPLSVHIDVNEIAAGITKTLTPESADYEPSSESGCVVIWHDCDRVEYKRLGWLEKALHRDLGRIYRRFILRGLALSINGIRVRAVDPLFLETGHFSGHSARLAFDPLLYELESSSGHPSHIEVRFSILPVHGWQQLDNNSKRRNGIVGGGGVSILRSGREIAFGWHLMGDKRKENYDDWWRCEIAFQPALDEHFGITINKQGIRPSAQLREALEPELQSIARLLNSMVRQQFEDLKFLEAAQKSCQIAARADRNLPALISSRRNRQVGPLTYRLTSGCLDSDEMLQIIHEKDVVAVKLNVDHPAFSALYGPLQSSADTADTQALRTAVELLILSYARASLSVDTPKVLRAWSETYARMLQKR